MQQDLADRHEAVNAFHSHLHQLPHGGRHASSGAKGLIVCLIILHLLFVAYWGAAGGGAAGGPVWECSQGDAPLRAAAPCGPGASCSLALLPLALQP